MSVVINGTGSISGLSNVGGIASAQSGSIIQTVTNSVASSQYASTNSTSFVTTGHSATITPRFSTSTILILVSAYVGYNYPSNAAVGGVYTIYRNSTNLAGGANAGFGAIYYPGVTGVCNTNLGINYVDSPATTSSTTYTVYFLSNNGSGTLGYGISQGTNINSSTATITLMEIAA
jgi:hypothetical protein